MALIEGCPHVRGDLYEGFHCILQCTGINFTSHKFPIMLPTYLVSVVPPHCLNSNCGSVIDPTPRGGVASHEVTSTATVPVCHGNI